MKKILIIITTAMVPYGGLSSVMMNLYRKLDKEKFHIDFASTNTELDENLEQELNMHGSSYFSLGNRKKNIIRYIKQLSKILKHGNYDVVHINSNSATALIELLIAKIYGVKKRIVHNHTSICDHKIMHFICLPFFRNSYTNAIACSKKAGEWIFREPFTILNNGIDAEKYRYSSHDRKNIRKLLSINDTTVVLGHLGKIYTPKNHHFIIQIFEQYHMIIPDSCLLLVGDGELRKDIENEVREKNLSRYVIFAGMQKMPEKFLSAMDFFIFPSIWEGMPLSMIEAQASGLPCLVSNAVDLDVKITDDVQMLPIDKGTDVWVHTLSLLEFNDRVYASDKNIMKIKSAMFDSEENARLLESIYFGN